MPDRRLNEQDRAKLTDRLEQAASTAEVESGRYWNLREMARAMSGVGTALSTEPLRRVAAAGDKQLAPLAAIAAEVREFAPDAMFAHGPDEGAYIEIWRVSPQRDAGNNGEKSLYVQVVYGDEPDEQHDHPWPTATLVLSGSAVEDHGHGTAGRHEPGVLVLRAAHSGYRLRVPADGGAGPLVLLTATGADATDRLKWRDPLGGGAGEPPERPRERVRQAGEADGPGGAVQAPRERGGRRPAPARTR